MGLALREERVISFIFLDLDFSPTRFRVFTFLA